MFFYWRLPLLVVRVGSDELPDPVGVGLQLPRGPPRQQLPVVAEQIKG